VSPEGMNPIRLNRLNVPVDVLRHWRSKLDPEMRQVETGRTKCASCPLAAKFDRPFDQETLRSRNTRLRHPAYESDIGAAKAVPFLRCRTRVGDTSRFGMRWRDHFGHIHR
jgi:hypothetical protein